MNITHRSLFDGTLQGVAHQSLPLMGFQGHPEAGPGPVDLMHLFANFMHLIEMHRLSKCKEFEHA